MTPNPKHLEILIEVSTYSKTYLKKEYAFVYASDALAAMQILQNRINELEKENEELNRKLNLLKKFNLQKTIESEVSPEIVKKHKITEHKLRELKNPRNPEI